ncbi:MAG: amino acid permease, partial [Rickettsiaceae bacterium]|nr:amino acid permease [Rickettsiaceae bacterium]
FCPLDLVVKVASTGALLEYITVMIVVMLFRVREPGAQRSFKCPSLFFIAPTGILACVYMLQKQAIDKDGSITTIGQILIGWIGFAIALYIVRSLVIKTRE